MNDANNNFNFARTGLLNLILRGLTIISKFVLVFSMSHYLLPKQVGQYSLFTTTISIAVYILGMDFYTYNTREILNSDQIGQARLIKDQLVFHGLIYIVALPSLALIFLTGTLANQYLIWFYLLLVLEHLSQELNRLLITLARTTLANLILFIRSGIWIYAVALIFLWKQGPRSLEVIWIGWAAGSLTSVVIGVFTLHHLPWKQAWHYPVDWQWLRTAFFRSLPFFAATMISNIANNCDRYFIKHYLGDAMVGVYFFYTSIATLIVTFVDVSIYQVFYAKIISLYQNGRRFEYRALIRKVLLFSLISALGVAIIMALGIKPVLNIFGKKLYRNYLPLFWVLLVNGLLGVGLMLPSLCLYVRRVDYAFMSVNTLVLIISIGLNILLLPAFGLIGAAYAKLGSSIVFVIAYGIILKVVLANETC